MGVSLDGVRVPLSRRRVADVARAVFLSERSRHALLSITFVSKRAIRALNRAHLRRDAVTDVIAFSYRQPGRHAPIVGDVYIAPDVARGSAVSLGLSLREEIVRLVVHGTLHVLGHDHPDGPARVKSAMWRRQERLVRHCMDSRR